MGSPEVTPDQIRASKLLSYVLRHCPDSIGISLDKNGWANVDELIQQAAQHEVTLTRATLAFIVKHNDKQRFTLSTDGSRIRAVQGHSVEVDLQLVARKPPPVLYHGTVGKNLASIRRSGLVPGSRQHVHLSETRETATAVGGRKGKPVVLVIDCYRAVQAGIKFYRAENSVWLVNHLPSEFIRFPS
jgi:putative RNA 2'-phosphotransferase